MKFLLGESSSSIRLMEHYCSSFLLTLDLFALYWDIWEEWNSFCLYSSVYFMSFCFSCSSFLIISCWDLIYSFLFNYYCMSISSSYFLCYYYFSLANCSSFNFIYISASCFLCFSSCYSCLSFSRRRLYSCCSLSFFSSS